ncbi:MAG: [cytidine(C)-cytidine(C)-adenosine (A)]-adding enzyme [Archangiaceae bacterium]|nr:[cytidine(C)-cytidine(C)-adenosine (A)]-adding enzyme [Archangiaceae bacterium]
MTEIPASVLEVHRRLKEAGFKAYLVGGCVRDRVLGKQPKDFDLATSARPEEVQRVFKKVIPTGIQHGTVTVIASGVHVEVTTFRTEGDYVDGRRPEKVEFHSDVEADLSRRDFTINAMAEDPITGERVDPFGGEADLKRHLVRCVRDPLERFGEDGLRCLRAVRFATVLAFDIEPATEAAIAPRLPVFRKVAMERVRDELLKIIVSPHVARGLELLTRVGLTREIFGFEQLDAAAIARTPPQVELRLAVLFRSAGECQVDRLKLPSAQTQRVRELFARRPPAERDDVTLRRWLSEVGLDLAGDLCRLDAAELDLGRFEKAPLSTKDLALDGAEIMKTLQTSPGPVVGKASRFLLDQVLQRPELNTPQELRALLLNWRP